MRQYKRNKCFVWPRWAVKAVNDGSGTVADMSANLTIPREYVFTRGTPYSAIEKVENAGLYKTEVTLDGE